MTLYSLVNLIVMWSSHDVDTTITYLWTNFSDDKTVVSVKLSHISRMLYNLSIWILTTVGSIIVFFLFCYIMCVWLQPSHIIILLYQLVCIPLHMQRRWFKTNLRAITDLLGELCQFIFGKHLNFQFSLYGQVFSITVFSVGYFSMD